MHADDLHLLERSVSMRSTTRAAEGILAAVTVMISTATAGAAISAAGSSTAVITEGPDQTVTPYSGSTPGTPVQVKVSGSVTTVNFGAGQIAPVLPTEVTSPNPPVAGSAAHLTDDDPHSLMANGTGSSFFYEFRTMKFGGGAIKNTNGTSVADFIVLEGGNGDAVAVRAVLSEDGTVLSDALQIAVANFGEVKPSPYYINRANSLYTQETTGQSSGSNQSKYYTTSLYGVLFDISDFTVGGVPLTASDDVWGLAFQNPNGSQSASLGIDATYVAAAVPEPAWLGVLSVAGLMLYRRRSAV
jgi:hypothetical protein